MQTSADIVLSPPDAIAASGRWLAHASTAGPRHRS